MENNGMNAYCDGEKINIIGYGTEENGREYVAFKYEDGIYDEAYLESVEIY